MSDHGQFAESVPVMLYAVVGPSGGGDLPGVLVDGETGAVIWSHVSSSRWWSEQDLTVSFGRNYELARRYPDGYDVTFLDGWSQVPDKVRARNDEWAAARVTPPGGTDA